MSIDLDWSKLDASFASSLIDVLNRQLQSTPRPSFIGPIEITSFDVGSQPPVVELVDLRDIYRDFLEDDDDDDDDDVYENNIDAAGGFSRYSPAGQGRRDDDEEYEWVSRGSARRGMAMEDAAPMYYHHLPPHVRYARGPASDVYSAPPEPAPAPLQPSSSSVGGSGAAVPVASTATHPEQHASTFSLSPSASASASAAADTSSWRDFRSGQQTRNTHSSNNLRSSRPTGTAVPSSASAAPSFPPLPHPHPDLADVDVVAVAVDPEPAEPAAAAAATTVVTTTATVTKDNTGVAGLTTIPTAQNDPTAAAAPPPAVPAEDEHPNLQLHLLVSWHSDLRLTLTTSLRINYPSPLFMSLPIKLSVTGLVFNGELAVAYEGGRRVHLCVLDGLDPYGPSARRASGSQGSTPSDPEGDDAHAAKPLPVGQRLLPEIFIESELGQADKHVLKNVTRVEKFIQDVIRKTIEEELVFPNFHTLVLR
jgi:mitochondrial distribution and morphology protein 12